MFFDRHEELAFLDCLLIRKQRLAAPLRPLFTGWFYSRGRGQTNRQGLPVDLAALDEVLSR